MYIYFSENKAEKKVPYLSICMKLSVSQALYTQYGVVSHKTQIGSNSRKKSFQQILKYMYIL